MKTSKKTRALQRRALDQKLNGVHFPDPPRQGWIKAVRESLLMTSAQLAERLAVAQPVVTNMEKREAVKKITLETLERAATALNCRLVYAFVPNEKSLEVALDQQTKRAATEISKVAGHSMALENQGVGQTETAAQIRDLAQELKHKGDRRIWAMKKGKQK
jgi:predicted DNA-binding mobile mystery protein A